MRQENATDLGTNFVRIGLAYHLKLSFIQQSCPSIKFWCFDECAAKIYKEIAKNITLLHEMGVDENKSRLPTVINYVKHATGCLCC